MRLPVPPFFDWINCVAGEPTITLPKLTLDGVTVMAGCTALPVTGMTVLAPWELETVMFPVIFSETVGLNDMLIEAFCPAANVNGVVMPLVLKSLAFTAICEIVTLEFPLFVTVTLFELELPALTLVKLTLVGGLADEVTDAAVPVPLNDRTFRRVGCVLAMLTVPARLPAVVGANSTLSIRDARAANCSTRRRCRHRQSRSARATTTPGPPR